MTTELKNTIENTVQNKLTYFAYGSNMSLARLRNRVPSAERIGAYRLLQHVLQFHKAGSDGSAKCDVFFTGRAKDYLLGAAYMIDPSEKVYLDRVEGLHAGYEIKTVQVENDVGEPLEAFTYYATDIDPAMKPYAWYLQHVIKGAQELALPKSYIEDLKSTENIEDPDVQRANAELSIYDSSPP